MMEETADNTKGIVNQGFSVEFSSEDESSEADTQKASSDIETAAIVHPTSGNFYGLPQNRSGLSTEGRRNESFSFPQSSKTTASQEDLSSSFSPSASSEQAIITKTSSNNSTIEENVQPDTSINSSPKTSMLITETIAPSQFANGNSVQNSSVKLSLGDNKVPANEYFRDVRLSLDPSSKGLPFHTNDKGNYGTQKRNSFEEHESDSFCDSCRQKVLFKLIFKYVVERPLFCFALWALFYIFWGDDALPGGGFFGLAVLEISALCLGYAAELVQLPGLLGMVAAGLILRNVPHIDVAKDLDPTLTSSLRGTSIVILLIRGGLGVNLDNVVKFKNIIPPLVLGSCILEAMAATVAVYYIIEFPLEWAALTGCIIAAMSGAAVVPYLASTEKSLSETIDPFFLSLNYKKVITIARSACGLDAMVAICLAEVALGFIFAEGNVGDGVIKGIVELILGGAFGIVWGFLAAFLLDDSSGNEKRVLAVFAGATMSLLGMGKIGFPRGGPLAAFLGTLIVGTVWKKKQIGGSNNEQLSASFTLIWYIFQPLLFAIIGARTDFDTVDWSVVTKGLICLAISLVVRTITSFCMTSWGHLELKERIYLCIAWLPKGTVQAALGPAALDTASGIKDLKSPDEYADLGYKVMNISAATFITAATLGCLCLRFIAPRLLYKHK